MKKRSFWLRLLNIFPEERWIVRNLFLLQFFQGAGIDQHAACGALGDTIGCGHETRVAGGQQQLYGLFLQDVYTPIPQLEIVGGIRGDYWRAYDAFRRDTPPPAGVPVPKR